MIINYFKYLCSTVSEALSESLSLVCLVFPDGSSRRKETPPPTTSDNRVLREPAASLPSSNEAEHAVYNQLIIPKNQRHISIYHRPKLIGYFIITKKNLWFQY